MLYLRPEQDSEDNNKKTTKILLQVVLSAILSLERKAILYVQSEYLRLLGVKSDDAYYLDLSEQFNWFEKR